MRLVLSRRRRGVIAVLGAGVLTSGVLAVALPAYATGSTFYASPTGSGSCSQASPCALATAVSDAGDGDTVVLADGLYSDVVLSLTKSSTLISASPGVATVQGEGGGIAPVTVNAGAPTLDNLTIGQPSQDSGGAVAVSAGALTIEDSTLTSNLSVGGGSSATVDGSSFGNGAAIGGLAGSTISINDSTVGGGIDGSGSVSAVRSTIDGGIGGLGPGLSHLTLLNSTVNHGLAGVLINGSATITDSTITGAGATGIGGSGNVSLLDSTIANVGGTGVIANGGAWTIQDTTITGNGGNGIDADGATVALRASIVADNATPDCQGGGISDNGYDLDDDGSCHLTGPGSVSDIPIIRNYLGPLSNNGGATQTVPLLTVPSPSTTTPDPAAHVIPGTFTLADGSTHTCSTPDQRGVARTAPCDIGAYQSPAVTVTSTSTPTPTPTPSATPTTTPSTSPTSTTTSGVPVLGAGPTIDGTAKVGNQLICKVSYSGATGGDVAWLRNGQRIPGTNHETYQVTPADYPGQIMCATEAYNAAGVSAVSFSPPVTVHLGAALRPSVVPYLTGTVRVGRTLTAHHGRWSPAASNYTYQWMSDGRRIPGATQDRYKIREIDQGKTLVLDVEAHLAGYAPGTISIRIAKVRAALHSRL